MPHVALTLLAVKRKRSKSISKYLAIRTFCMVAICKSIYVVYRINSTHKFLPSGLDKYFCMGENGWRISLAAWQLKRLYTLPKNPSMVI